ncbi:DUF1127 domain-containing protein [Agrobacterium sp. a22-2]|uniref:DUF1127 domain-containing protein n=1 Tax=Agrobacterium sp. a22-2 TaxID=2283840 RepID=UPI001FEF34BC|nr:DUF1127 domain-containing protein [Agrobacterium sp. a22-2]
MTVRLPADSRIIGRVDLQARLFARKHPKTAVLARLVAMLGLCWRRHRERQRMQRDLPGFTDEMLRDFGLTRAQAEEQAGRPFWRA